MKQIGTRVVYRCKDIYIDTVDEYLMIFKPFSKRGLSLLDKSAAFIFNLVDNKKTINEIFKISKKKDINVRLEDITDILKKLIDTEAVTSNFYSKKKIHIPPSKKRLTAWFHLTNQCNLRCTYCYVSKSAHSMSEDIGKKSIDKLLVDGKKNGFEIIKVSFAGGECLLEFKKLQYFVEYAEKKAREVGIIVEFGMTTNGTLITNEVAKYIKKHHILTAVSLDGFGKYNDAQRIFADGSGTFKYIEKGIKTLQKHGILVHILITITNYNISNIPEIFNFCFKNKIVFGTNLFRDNPCVGESELTLKSDRAITYLRKAFKLAYKNVLTEPDRDYFAKLVNTMFDRVQISSPHERVCGVGRSYLTISHLGQISTCSMTLEQPIGTIEDEDIVKTMKEKSFVFGKKLITEVVPSCKSCSWRYLCCGGCPFAFLHKEGLDMNPDYCDVYKTLIPELLRIEARRLIKWGKQL